MGLSKQLISSAEQGNISTIRVLLSRNAVDVDASDQEQNTALHYAAKEGHVAAVRLLLQHGADYNNRNSYGWTALMQAAAHGHVRAVRCLLEFGAPATARDKFDQSALVVAAANGHNDIAQRLVAESNEQLSLALAYAAYYGRTSTVKLLLHLGAEPSETLNSKTTWSALLYALHAGNLHVCETLLNHGTPSLETVALYEIIRTSQTPNKAALMELVSDYLPLPESSKAISIAIEQGDLEGLKKVICLADQESYKLMGGTPLMFASVMGQCNIVKWLLETGSDINSQDENNEWTALMQAVFHGHYIVVEYLLAAGADPEIGNKDGLNAHSIATMLGDEHMSDLLIRQCVAPNGPGKKWWLKLTTKFSTIRALTAFKGKIRRDGSISPRSPKGMAGDPLCPEDSSLLFKEDDNKLKRNMSQPPTDLVIDHTEETLVERITDPENIVTETQDMVYEMSPPSPDTSQDVAPSLISPDSGFISRHDDSPSVPFSATLTECEYDGLNVTAPELPDGIGLIEPDFDWYPDDMTMSESTLRNMGAEEDVIQDLRKLNVVL